MISPDFLDGVSWLRKVKDDSRITKIAKEDVKMLDDEIKLVVLWDSIQNDFMRSFHIVSKDLNISRVDV